MADSDRQFEYLLNSMERAAQTGKPAEHDYAGKRKAVFDYVRRLEVVEREARPLADLMFDAGQLADQIRKITNRVRAARAEDY